jgi:hypothetical protein
MVRYSDGIHKRHFAAAVQERPVMDSRMPRPSTQRHCHAVVGDWVGKPRIDRLLLWCCPPAVLRRVVAVIVDAVNAASVWALSHVGEKRSEGVVPSVAHTYSPSSILEEGRVVLVFASVAHCRPHPVKRVVGQAVELFGLHNQLSVVKG